MNAAFFAFLSLLLSSGCSSGFKIDHNGNGIEAYQSVQIPLNLINLNNDILYMILDKLEIGDLLNAAEALPELTSIIDEVFKRKYFKTEHTFLHIILFSNLRPVRIGDTVRSSLDSIMIGSREDSIYMLKRFGHFIKNVMIHHAIADSSNVEIINRALNQYCPETLKRLCFSFGAMNMNLNEFTTSFKEVEEFSTHITTDEVEVFQALNETFPNLRRLNLWLDEAINISFVDGMFPHLNHFVLQIENYPEDAKTEFIEQLKEIIRKNPTIQNIEIRLKTPSKFVKYLSEALPNLENLTLSYLQVDRSDTVLFGNVKNLVLNPRLPDHIDNLRQLSFPHLEAIEMTYISKCSYEWIEFLKKHTHVRQLQITDRSHLFANVPELNQLLGDLSNLADLKIITDFYYGIESIVEFIQDKRQFEKVHLKFQEQIKGVPTADVTALQEQFQNEWTIETVEGVKNDKKINEGLIFVRK